MQTLVGRDIATLKARRFIAVTALLFSAVWTLNAQTVAPAPFDEKQLAGQKADEAVMTPAQTNQFSASQFFFADGLNVEQLVEIGLSQRADLLAARQRLVITQAAVRQASLRPNPTLQVEYGSPRFLGGEAETDFSVGASQVFEIGGKRRKRIAVAELTFAQTRAQVVNLERGFAAEIRAGYARIVAAANQLETLENLMTANRELVRVTNERVKEGDVAPLDLNLVELETNRLQVQTISMRATLDTEMIALRALINLDSGAPLRLIRPPAIPPRLDLSVTDATNLALRERADLQAARIGEQLGAARIGLAQAQATPNLAASVRYGRSRQLLDVPPQLGITSLSDVDNELTFGVSIEIPIFNRNQGQIAAAVGEREQAIKQREFLETAIRQQVALALRRYRAAAESYVLYATQIVPRAEANLRSVRAAYNLGEYAVFDVVNEQRRLTESQTGLNEALANYYAALAELERVLGTPLPPDGFAPTGTSVLPDASIPPLRPDAELQKMKTFSSTRHGSIKNP